MYVTDYLSSKRQREKRSYEDSQTSKVVDQTIFIFGVMILLKETSRGQEVLVTPNDVPASKLIERLAKYLKQNVDAVTPPPWATIVKTGAHVQQQPQNADWWYARCASILRKIYVHGPVGIQELRANYGGRKSRGVKPQRAAKAGGSIIRKALQQLEAAGYVETVRPRGRRVTTAGSKLLRELTEEVGREIAKELPELQKYLKGD
jgi:small subunit ribosomal protein S19e